MRRLILSVLFLAVPILTHAVENDAVKGFLCIPDFATGFSIGSSGKWGPTQFDVKDKKYLLRIRNGSWFWTDFGEEPDSHIDLCDAFNEHGFTDCKNREDEVRFNRNTLRFQVIRPYGYVVADFSVDKTRHSTPFYEIGTCSPL